jgi:hypothetical protein
MERTGGDGKPSEFPPDYVEIDVADGVIVDQTFVERAEPLSLHNLDSAEEDDDFLSVGSESWDYDIADGREDEFIAALKNSQMAFECISLDGAPGEEPAGEETTGEEANAAPGKAAK